MPPARAAGRPGCQAASLRQELVGIGPFQGLLPAMPALVSGPVTGSPSWLAPPLRFACVHIRWPAKPAGAGRAASQAGCLGASRLLQAWSAAGSGLVVSERLINCPPQLAPPLQQNLFDEARAVAEDEDEKKASNPAASAECVKF